MNNLGLLLALALLGIAFIAGVFAAATRLPAMIRLIGATLAFAVTGVVIWGLVDAYRTGFVDLNPRVTDADVVGRWICGFGALSLRADGAFALTGREAWSGRWSRHHCNLSLRDDANHKEYWRVVTFSGTPVLLREWRDPASPMPRECRRGNALQQQAVQQ